jgi:[acyl-carrier-protein] S-malonyltransferase
MELPETAILFPGQGVGDESSRELVATERPDLLDLATELVGEDPFARIGDGTAYAQPAVYCASIAGFRQLGRPLPAYFAGHSLGEVGALAAAGALDDLDGLRAVVARGRAMEKAARESESGGMMAVGADREAAEELAAEHRLTLANENSPEQFVVSGPLKGIEAAASAAKAGGIRAKRLAVAGAFHTAQMAEARKSFRAALEAIRIREPRVPVISSVTGEVFAGDPRDTLAEALVRPVRWIAVLGRLRALGVTRYVDVGPGRVLAGLVRKTLSDPEVETVTIKEAAVA